jgi:hypothetical protein
MLRILFGLTSLVVLLVFIGFSATGAPSDPNPSDLGLTATPTRAPDGTWSLQFELQYTGDRPLTLSERSLPWKSSRDLLLVATVLNSTRTRLAEFDPPAQAPAPALLTLNPGDALAGSVNLSGRFPVLAEALRESDVVIFWSHQVRSAERPSLARLNGGVVLSRLN